MARYNFTAHAAQDLRHIIRYTKHNWGVRQARVYRQELELSFTQLAEKPGVGRQRDEIAPGMRSFRVAKHIAFYTSRRGGITILRLLHPSMDAELALAQEPGKDEA